MGPHGNLLRIPDDSQARLVLETPLETTKSSGIAHSRSENGYEITKYLHGSCNWHEWNYAPMLTQCSQMESVTDYDEKRQIGEIF